MDYLKKRKCFSLAANLHKHYLDLGSDTSSKWNFCACFSYVISWRNHQWRREMAAVFSSYREKGKSPSEILSLFNLSSSSVHTREATHLYLDIIQSFLKCGEDLGGKSASHSLGECSAVCTQDVHRYRKVSKSRKCNAPTARVHRE